MLSILSTLTEIKIFQTFEYIDWMVRCHQHKKTRLNLSRSGFC